MNGGPSGFNNAPVTRTVVIASVLFTILFGIRGRSSKLGWSYQDIFKKLQIWRLIVSVFAFSSTPELVIGIYLLYFFRVFERQIDPSMKITTSGPYGLIFSSFIPFYFDIPVSTRFRVLGFQFSNKTFTYLAGLQLLLSSWKRSMLPGICGILAGLLYRLNIFDIRRLKFPNFIASFFSRLSWPSVGSASPTGQGRNAVGNAPTYAGLQVEGTHPARSSSTVNPTEDSIATLVSMGFDRNSARQALIRAKNDINAATNILLESQTN